ncbi:MAG: hypothetical protein CR977_00050 [Gammaproteobacteria bacterium]|nr:MAG: hypothetical protein CR977_00050 [Gammaproteobacteria bacterium]
MVIAINDTLLESIKKELLVTLNAAEGRVVDIFEFGETHGSEETLNLLRSAKNTLTMIGEQAAAALCEVILVTIEQSLTADNSEVQGELADSFLTLTQYIQRLSVDGEQHEGQLKAQLLDEAKRNLLDETSSAAAASPMAYALTDKQRQTLTKVRQFLAKLPKAAANNPQNFWQGLYKAAKALLPQLQTRENYEYIWLLEQIAVVNIKGAVATADDLQQQLYTAFVAYCDALDQQGETLSLYQQHGEDAVTHIKQLIGSADVMRNDYTPPTKRLQQHDGDDLGISIVFPVSAETIESIAFLIKKELATTKNIFEKALENDTLDTQAVREQLSDSLASSKATFKLLGFATGLALIDEAENHLQQTAGDDSWQQAFAECVILIEDALWELDYLESGSMVNPYDAYHQQTAHSTKMAVIAAKLITAQVGHAFFKAAREQLIESFAETDQLDLMHDAKAVHDLRSAMSLFDEEALAEQLGKTERAQLFLINNPQVLAETSNTNAYLDVLVGYEIIFEQLRHSKTVDARALALLDSEIQKLLAGIHFNMEQMATPDYGVFAAMDADGHDAPQAALESLDTLPDLPEESDEAADSEVTADTLSDTGVASSHAAQQSLAPQSTGGAVSTVGGAIANKVGSVNQPAGSEAEQTGAADSLAAVLSQASINTEVESVPDSEIDEEILEIFLQEAKEISTQLANDIRQLKGNYFNEELLANLRRHEKLFNKAVNNELQLNDIAQQWLETSQALVADVVNSEPFVEDKDALLQAAAEAEAICKALTDGELDEIAPAVSAGDIGVGAAGEVRTGEDAAGDLTNLSDAEIDALAQRLSTRQAQAAEALADVAGHPALGDTQADTSEVGSALEKIAQVASLLNKMGDVKCEDINPMFHAIGQIERDTLNETQQAVAEQLAEIAETSKGLADNALNNTHIEQISAAVGAMNSADLPAQLSDIMNGLQAVKDDLEAQAGDTNLVSDDISWVLDYAQTTNILYSQWAEENFKKGSAFNGLHQNSITLEQMLLNNRLHQPIAISNKLRQLLDEINRHTQKTDLTDAVTQSIGEGIDEVVRLLSAMVEQQTEVVASAEVLTALDNALATVQADYPAYDLPSGDGAVAGTSGMVNLAQQMEAQQRSAGQADRFAQQGNEDELSAYFESSAATLKAAKADFVTWQDADFAKNDALRQLREHVKQLRDGAFEVNHLDSRFVTQAIYDTLGNVNRSEKRPTVNEATAIKSALDELSRIHNEVMSGEIGEANPLILNNLAEASNSVLDFSPNEVQPAAPQGVSSMTIAQADDSIDDNAAKQGMATAYLGQAGDLHAQIEAAKREFTPANFIAGAAEHSKLIDALYDVEASLDDQDSSTWAWEMLSNIEGIITNMQSKSLFPSPDDYQAISEALDAISDNKAVDAKAAKKINNSLMGIRAGLTGREMTRALAGKFASAAKEELQATDESFDAWKISGFEPRGELADLIGDVDEVDVKAEQMEYSDASELSSLLNTVLKRLQNENLIPYDMVSETVEKAIEEITTVAPQVHGDHLASPELRSMLDDHAIETSVGVKYVPFNDSDQLTDELIEDISAVDTVVTRGVVDKPLAAADEAPKDVNLPDLTALASDLSDDNIGAGAETTAQDAKATAGTGAVAEIETTSQDTSAAAAGGEASSAEASDLLVDKQGFAEAALPHIRQSRSHFDAWESGGFADKQPLASLSSSFKDISEVSESHHFQDAYDLASTVNDVLDRVYDEVAVPNELTTESVNEAINEFDSTTQAIRSNDNSEGAQSISDDLMAKMRAIAVMPNLGKPAETTAASADMPDGAASSVATDAPSSMADNVAAATAKTGAEAVQTSATGMPVDDLPELDADTVSSLQAFARDAQPHISASKSHFSHWQASDFMENHPRQQLLDSVQEITDLSEQHAVEDSADLGHAVNEVLQRLAAKDLRPSDTVATQLDSALTEFERTTQAIQQGAPGQTIRPDILNDTQAVAIAALNQLGQPIADYQPAPVAAATAAGLATGAGQNSKMSASPVAAAMQAATADEMAPQTSATDSLYLPFVKEAKPAIDSSKDSFERWRATDFSLDEPLDSLSNDVKDITDISEKHDFSSGARLGQTVSEILERISDAGTRPALETTEQVESAINEFSRSAQAISDNAPYQDIQEEVINQIARVSQMIAGDTTTSLTSSVAAHEMFTASPTSQPAVEQTQQAFSQGLESVMSSSDAVSIGDSVTEKSEVSSMSAQLGDKGQKTGMRSAAEQVPFGGLKFNDPEELDETILDIFLNEARDIVKRNDNSLNEWQADYGDLSALQEMQRGLHTLKGGARMAELTVLGGCLIIWLCWPVTAKRWLSRRITMLH